MRVFFLKEQTSKYPLHVMQAVKASHGAGKSSAELDQLIERMQMTEVMDCYLESLNMEKDGKTVRQAVYEVYGIDLTLISNKNYGNKLNSYHPSVMESLRFSLGVDRDSTEMDAHIMSLKKNEVMDRFMEAHDLSLSGAESRLLINQIYGVNLDGISGLEHANSRITIQSKGQWVLRGEKDLFVVSSSLDDVELYVFPSAYYAESTGTDQVPVSLAKQLVEMGYSYDASNNQYVYRNPTGESVPDHLKGQVLVKVADTIKSEF